MVTDSPAAWIIEGRRCLIPCHIVFPVCANSAVIPTHHRDAFIYRTDIRTEITAHTILFDNLRDAMTIIRMYADGLVRSVFTCDITKLAANTFVRIDLGDDFVMQVERFPRGHFVQRFTDEVVEGLHVFITHELFKSRHHFFDDPETIMHHCGTHLDIGSAEQEIFYRVLPGFDAADSGYGKL